MLKCGGKFCVVAPTVWEEHDFPLDCYRYYPSGMRALCKWVGLDCIESNYKRAYDVYEDFNGVYMDCYCIGVKP